VKTVFFEDTEKSYSGNFFSPALNCFCLLRPCWQGYISLAYLTLSIPFGTQLSFTLIALDFPLSFVVYISFFSELQISRNNFCVVVVAPFSIFSEFLLRSAFSYYSSMATQRPLPQGPIPSMLIPRYLVLFYRHTHGHGKTIRNLHTSIDTRLNIRYLTVTSLKCNLFFRLGLHQQFPTCSALLFY